MLGCLCWQFLYGATIKKNEVAGRIVDESSKQPMEFADVALYRATDSVFITGTVTDKRGCFAFNPVALETYYIECSFIGYETHRSPVFTISGQTSMDLGILYLRSSTEQLNEVTVKGRRSTYVQRIDKRIFNVGSDLMSTSGSVSGPDAEHPIGTSGRRGKRKFARQRECNHSDRRQTLYADERPYPCRCAPPDSGNRDRTDRGDYQSIGTI